MCCSCKRCNGSLVTCCRTKCGGIFKRAVGRAHWNALHRGVGRAHGTVLGRDTCRVFGRAAAKSPRRALGDMLGREREREGELGEAIVGFLWEELPGILREVHIMRRKRFTGEVLIGLLRYLLRSFEEEELEYSWNTRWKAF